MTTYTVTATLQSSDGPKEMKWATNTNEMGVIQSVSQLIEQNKEASIHTFTPATLSIQITFNQE